MTGPSATTARLVTAGLDRNTAAIHAVPYAATADPAEQVRRCELLQRLYARRARWWAVLERAAVTDPAIPLVYVRAVVQARCAADHQASEWAMNVERWTDHARSDTSGAGVELVRGVSA